MGRRSPGPTLSHRTRKSGAPSGYNVGAREKGCATRHATGCVIAKAASIISMNNLAARLHVRAMWIHFSRFARLIRHSSSVVVGLSE